MCANQKRMKEEGTRQNKPKDRGRRIRTQGNAGHRGSTPVMEG